MIVSVRFFAIPPGSHAPFTLLGALRRGKQLANSRVYRTQLKLIARNPKLRKELRELRRVRGSRPGANLPTSGDHYLLR